MAGYCTLVLYFHSPSARQNTAARSCNIQPYCLLKHQIIYIYTSYIFCTQMQHLKNLASSCQLLRLVGDAAGRNVRDEDSSVSLSPDDVEP